MRLFRPNTRQIVVLVIVLALLGGRWISQRDEGGSPPMASIPPGHSEGAVEAPDKATRADFDFYLLALTSHPAFCADGHARKRECKIASPPLSIHGLWPEKLQPGRYPRDCPGPLLDLESDLERNLEPHMPGMADGLHEHEWRKHGRCTGLGDDEYFRYTLDATRKVQSALAEELATRAGRQVRAAELREVADARQPGLGATLTFHCRTLKDAPPRDRRDPHLIEIRQCLDDDGPDGAPGTPLDCARVQRRDQGCGERFRIAEARS